MGSVEVVEVSLPRETERFVRTWFTIYEDEPNWVPPLYFERKRWFAPAHNPYFENARPAYFVATRDGRDVGCGRVGAGRGGGGELCPRGGRGRTRPERLRGRGPRH